MSRREEHGEGNPEELENCIENQLRPPSASTFVEATFVKYAGTPKEEHLVLRRILTADYGATSMAMCESKLHLDGSELSKEEEAGLLDEFFSSVPPLLMQHTLRSFVHSPPSRRRRYFERILALNDLTDLIGKAVIGKPKLPGFKSPQENRGLMHWEKLIGQLENLEAEKSARKIESVALKNQPKALTDALFHVATQEFLCPSADITGAETWINQLQNDARKKTFPPLARLHPKRQPDDELSTSVAGTENRTARIEVKWKEFEESRKLTNAVQENALAIADALEKMIEAGLIEPEQAVQICPLCVHESPATLTRNRLSEIGGWKPLVEAEKEAMSKVDSEIKGLKRDLRTLIQEARDTLPEIPDLDDDLKEVTVELSDAASNLVRVRSRIETQVRPYLDDAQRLVDAETDRIASLTEIITFATECTACIDQLRGLRGHAEKYRQALNSLETIVGQAASSDEEYTKRQAWLTCVKSQAEILVDFKWERAKLSSQKDLADIRKELMKFRRKYLEDKRAMFNEGMQDVLSCLRADTYSAFSNLQIPEPKGKGFPVVLQVKAALDDGVETKEIDALKVFSESQVNALGVATFITRSRLLGHDLMFFDDPVQSMDEDHFKTFARDVLPPILDEGRQVIVLTHNETFARDISYWHYGRSNYVTLNMRLSQTGGCVVDEGNRRFSERLRNAEKLAKEGELRESWLRIRLAIERFYTVTNIKYGPNGFEPDSWKDQTAEYMWNDDGVGPIITGFNSNAGKRLYEILKMTAGGSHDKGVQGPTELLKATKFLRQLGVTMKISD